MIKKTKKCLIIGSGLSSDFFLKAINKKIKKNFLVLTGNFKNDANILKYDKREISITRSKNLNGLSKDWLGTSTIYTKESFNKKNFLRTLPKIQNQLLKKKIFSVRKLNDKYFPKDINNLLNSYSKNFIFQKSINLKNNQNEFALRPEKHNNVEYKNYKVFDIKKIGKKIYCYCINKNKQKIKIQTKYLIFACGTLETSILLLKLLNLKRLTFRHQPYFYGFFISKNNSKKFTNFNYPLTNYYYKNDVDFSGSLGTYSKRILKFAKLNFFSKNIFNYTKKFLFNNVIFFNCFINSKINELELKKKNNIFYLSSKLDKSRLNNICKNISKKFINKTNLLINNKIIFNKSFFPKIGFDKHYFGIKMKKSKTKLVNNNCELLGYKNIFIVDQSVINFDTSKFLTFFSISNSYRIGKIFNNIYS